MSTTVVVASNPDELALTAQSMIIDLLRAAIAKSQRGSIALSGGSTPKRLFELFASESKDAIDWSKIDLFWGDERNVPWEHPDSNYRMTCTAWLDVVHYPKERVHPVPIQIDIPDAAASEYEQTLRQLLPICSGNWPELDVILLGLGDDAHTASLFPGTAGISELNRVVMANYVDKLATWRITMSAPAINAAKDVLFLVSGKKKTHALEQIWHGPNLPNEYPAQLIRPQTGHLTWLIDRDALGDLSIPNHWNIREL